MSKSELEAEIDAAQYEWAKSVAHLKNGPPPSETELRSLGRVPFHTAAHWALTESSVVKELVEALIFFGATDFDGTYADRLNIGSKALQKYLEAVKK